MAKATATCKCEKCGKEFIKIATKNNRREANSWEEWAEAHFTVCPECYGKECREKEAAKGLKATFEWNLLTGDEIQLSITLTGDTYPIKDKLKAIGCRWNSCSYVWGRNFTVRDSRLHADLEEIDGFVKELQILGFEVIKDEKDEAVEENIRKYVKEKEESSKPEIKKPEILKNHKWNKTIYGRKERYIFLDGKKTIITEEQEKEIMAWIMPAQKEEKIMSKEFMQKTNEVITVDMIVGQAEPEYVSRFNEPDNWFTATLTDGRKAYWYSESMDPEDVDWERPTFID